MMMVLSTSLASLGLLADSTAVVIGAMRVAPLMGSLVAAGHSLVQVIKNAMNDQVENNKCISEVDNAT
ncbi:MAG: hypothetical protein PVG69_03530 [Desulfobacterales bacterium]|jgi:uncharacterized membrane protein